MVNLMHLSLGRQNLKTKAHFPRKTDGVGIFLNDGRLIRGINLRKFCQECEWEMTQVALVLQIGWNWAMFLWLYWFCLFKKFLRLVSICFLFSRTLNWTLPCLYILPINITYPKPSTVAYYSLLILNCSSSAIPK